MIARVWRGRSAPTNADAYGAFLRRTAFPDYGGVEGNKGWILLRRDTPNAVEFAFVSFWESMDAVRRYAGPDPERPKYYPEDKAFLLELPQKADHYEVVVADLRL
jgi:heme-degrading monooxygenase HmoA